MEVGGGERDFTCLRQASPPLSLLLAPRISHCSIWIWIGYFPFAAFVGDRSALLLWFSFIGWLVYSGSFIAVLGVWDSLFGEWCPS